MIAGQRSAGMQPSSRRLSANRCLRTLNRPGKRQRPVSQVRRHGLSWGTVCLPTINSFKCFYVTLLHRIPPFTSLILIQWLRSDSALIYQGSMLMHTLVFPPARTPFRRFSDLFLIQMSPAATPSMS